MRMTASWFGSLDLPDTRLWRVDRTAPKSGLPSDRHPDRTKRAIVLEAVKVWPGKGGASAKLVRRPTLIPARAGMGKAAIGTKNGSRIKKLMMEKMRQRA